MTADIWTLTVSAKGPTDKWGGVLRQRAERGAWIDVTTPRDSWKGKHPNYYGFGTWREALAAGIAQWLEIGYLTWGQGAILTFDGKIIAHVHQDGTRCRQFRCRWCAQAVVTEPGLCETCRQNEDAVEFQDAHEEQCGCGLEHILTTGL